MGWQFRACRKSSFGKRQASTELVLCKLFWEPGGCRLIAQNQISDAEVGFRQAEKDGEAFTARIGCSGRTTVLTLRQPTTSLALSWFASSYEDDSEIRRVWNTSWTGKRQGSSEFLDARPTRERHEHAKTERVQNGRVEAVLLSDALHRPDHRSEGQRGVEVFFAVLSRARKRCRNKHDDCEQLWHVVEGSGTLFTGPEREEHPVRAGDVVLTRRTSFTAWRTTALVCALSGDRRVRGRFPKDEPSWDAHVAAVCRQNGWNVSIVDAKHEQ